MVQKNILIVLAVVAAVAVVAVAVYSSGILSNNNDNNIDETGSKITLVTLEDGLKVTYNGKEIKCEESFYVPKDTIEAKIKVYLPEGKYYVSIWPANGTEKDDAYYGSDVGTIGTWADVSLYMFGDGEYKVALRHQSPS